MAEEESEYELSTPAERSVMIRLDSAEYMFKHFWRRRGDHKVRAFLRGQADVVRELRLLMPAPRLHQTSPGLCQPGK